MKGLVVLFASIAIRERGFSMQIGSEEVKWELFVSVSYDYGCYIISIIKV